MVDKTRLLKIILGVIGTILVGAIGSGVWQHILEPSLSLMRDGLLNVAVLGTTELKNAIYLQVARGLHEANSLDVYSLLLIFLALAFVISSLEIFTRNKDLRRRHTELLSEIERLKKGEQQQRPSLDEIHKELTAIPMRRVIWMARVTIAITLLYIPFLFFTQIRAQYINSAITHFDHMLLITKPHIDTAKVDVFKSQFAQIRNKADYALIIKDLERISKENKLRYPTFDPW